MKKLIFAVFAITITFMACSNKTTTINTNSIDTTSITDTSFVDTICID